MTEKAICKRIRMARIDMELTQAELGKKLGVAPNTVSGYETDTIDVDTKTLQALSTVLKKPVSYFTQGEEYQPEPLQEVQEPTLTSAYNSNIATVPIFLDLPHSFPHYTNDDIAGTVDMPRFLYSGTKWIVQHKDDQMVPVLKNGDYCIIGTIQELINNKMYLVKAGGVFLIRRVLFVKDRIELRTYSKRHKAIQVQKADLIGMVKGIFKKA